MCDNLDKALGQSARTPHTVSTSDLATVLGSGDVSVLGTPIVIAWMEQATVQVIAGFVEPHCTTVGTHVDVRHLIASVVGDSLDVSATLTSVKGRRLSFHVRAVVHDLIVAEGVITRSHVKREGPFR